jgi:hypothetical protein
LGTEGGVYDTSTPAHARGSPAAQLLRTHDPSLHGDYPTRAALYLESAPGRSTQPSSLTIGSQLNRIPRQPWLTSASLLPARPSRLSAKAIQYPYIHRANGLLQIAVSTLLRIRQQRRPLNLCLRSTVDTALEILRSLRIVPSRWGILNEVDLVERENRHCAY